MLERFFGEDRINTERIYVDGNDCDIKTQIPLEEYLRILNQFDAKLQAYTCFEYLNRGIYGQGVYAPNEAITDGTLLKVMSEEERRYYRRDYFTVQNIVNASYIGWQEQTLAGNFYSLQTTMKGGDLRDILKKSCLRNIELSAKARR